MQGFARICLIACRTGGQERVQPALYATHTSLKRQRRKITPNIAAVLWHGPPTFSCGLLLWHSLPTVPPPRPKVPNRAFVGWENHRPSVRRVRRSGDRPTTVRGRGEGRGTSRHKTAWSTSHRRALRSRRCQRRTRLPCAANARDHPARAIECPFENARLACSGADSHLALKTPRFPVR
jgi:hypothetical protein